MNIKAENLLHAVLDSLSHSEGPITRGLIDENLKAMSLAYSKLFKYDYTDEEIVLISKYIESIIPHKMNEGQTLKDKSHISWLQVKKETIDPYYWDRYKHILKKERSPDVLAKIDIITDEILDLLQDPSNDGKWTRKGLVVGDVQSGKTGNIIGLVTKAFDSGYKLVIVLSGLLNSLRQQTQERFDEGVIGLDSSKISKDISPIEKLIGVGKFKSLNAPITMTTVGADFNRKYAHENQHALEQYSKPIVFIIKKNVSILENLIGWLKNNNFNLDEYPLLLIDDESDHASINTNKEDLSPTKTNLRIRELLDIFPKKAYLGYTATPFANIFIDPETPEEMMNDLFPKHFIKVLDSPTNYFGSQKIYQSNKSNFLRPINDHNDILPVKHKIDEHPEILPHSLEKSIRNFILVCAIRHLRGDTEKHNSMLVNVSRFTGIQSRVRLLIHDFLSEIVNSIKGNSSLSIKEALKNNHINNLYELFKEEYSTVEFSWKEVQKALNKAASKIVTIEVNGSKTAEKIIDYSKENYPDGRSLIAVGGFSLSRGITIEGLSITYFLRNSFAYDTLMQMGRWFGYRPRYEDLCRVYMTNDSAGYYRSISNATEELKEEFHKMANSKPPKTPMDFGLKVRNHEGALLVTARNKMRSSRTIIRALDLTGRTIETSRLFSLTKIINKNINAASNLYVKLNAKEKKSKENVVDGRGSKLGHKLWRGISIDYILNFLHQYENHPASQISDTDVIIKSVHELSLKKSIDKWNVIFDSPNNNRKIKIDLPDSLKSINPSVREEWSPESETNGILLSHRSLGSQKIKILDLKQNEERTVPVLRVHLLDFRKNGNPIFNNGNIGYSITFPGQKVMGRVKIEASYQVNKKWWKDHYGELQENDNDLGDDIESYV